MSSFDTPLPPYNSTDPSATFLNASCLDLLMIELVPMAYRVTHELDSSHRNDNTTTTAAAAAAESGSVAAAASPQHQHQQQAPTASGTGRSGGGSGVVARGLFGGLVSAAGGGGGSSSRMDEDEERDAVFYRLEVLGYRVGQGLVERFSRDRPRFTDTLDMIKFLCKDLWMLLFRKQIDNLKTNHRGVYVLTDNTFRPFSRMSTEVGGQAVVRAQPFLWFPSGIIRGALASMGINATVLAESSDLPVAVFQIKSLSTPAGAGKG